MHRDYGFGSRSYGFPDGFGVNRQVFGLYVNQNRFGPGQRDRVGGGDEGDVRNYYFVSRADAETFQRQKNGGSSARGRDGVFRAGKCGNFFLEFLRQRPLIYKIVIQRFFYEFIFLVSDLRHPPGDFFMFHIGKMNFDLSPFWRSFFINSFPMCHEKIRA